MLGLLHGSNNHIRVFRRSGFVRSLNYGAKNPMKYDPNRGQYVLQIKVQGIWQDYLTLKSQADLSSACHRVGNNPNLRVVHQFMGTTVLKRPIA